VGGVAGPLFAEEGGDLVAQLAVVLAECAVVGEERLEPLVERGVAGVFGGGCPDGCGGAPAAEPLDLGAEGGVAVEQGAGHLGGVGDRGHGDRCAVVVETTKRGVCPCSGGLGSLRVAVASVARLSAGIGRGLLLDGLERVDDVADVAGDLPVVSARRVLPACSAAVSSTRVSSR
jgi:hypothetical protein